jgi:hypothetical protein
MIQYRNTSYFFERSGPFTVLGGILMKQKRKVRVWLCAALAACAIASIALIVAIQQSVWAGASEATDSEEYYYIGHSGVISDSDEMFCEPDPPSPEDVKVPPLPELINDLVNTGTCIPPE